MIRYWDYSEKERAGLTREQVQAMLTVEMMEKGCLDPGVSPETKVPEKIDLPKFTYFRVQRDSYNKFDCLFPTMEAAQAFVALKPLEIGYTYDAGERSNYADVPDQLGIVTVEMYSKEDITRHRDTLKRIAAQNTANKKSIDDHAEAVKKANKITEGVWDDWHSCQETGRGHQRVIDTFGKYVATADGDREIARKFLVKAFTEEEVKAAFAWTGVSDPAITPADLTEPEDMPDPPLRMEVQKPKAWIDREPAVV